jgi:uncharacterized membrane protein
MLGIVVLSFLLAVYYYPLLPDKVASHWNIEGEVDGYLDKFWGISLFPILSVFLFLLFIGIPRIDPLKQNIEKFKVHYERFITIIMVFFLYIFILFLLANTGMSIDLGRFMMPALGVLFFYAGVLIQHAERNWFIGIRTPWTMSSEKVWKKTHKRGAVLFKLSGLIMFLGFFLQGIIILYVVLAPILLSVVYLFAYSYFEYQKVKGKK